MPRHEYDAGGRYQGYSLGDRERDAVKLVDVREYREKHGDDHKYDVLFSRAFAILLMAVFVVVAVVFFSAGERRIGPYFGLAVWTLLPAVAAFAYTRPR